MTAKRDRIPTREPREALTHSPFAALSGDAAPAAPAPATTPPRQNAPAPARRWKVARTRKGGWPLRVERRGGGKVVTILGSVEGDSDTLLKALRRLCGTGGVVREGAIELQGDQVGKVTAFLED